MGTANVAVSVTVDNYATADIVQTGGAGVFSRVGNTITLNLGAFSVGSGDVIANLDLANIAGGPADGVCMLCRAVLFCALAVALLL